MKINKHLLTLTLTLTSGGLYAEQVEQKTPSPVLQTEALNTYFLNQRHVIDIADFFKADISYMIADIKFDGQNLKILEFGEGPRSKFVGYDSLYGRGKLWTNFWYYLKQFHIPVWFVTFRAIQEREEFEKEIDFPTFQSIGGSCLANLTILENDPSFKQVNSRTVINSTLGDFKGIAILNYHNSSNMNHDPQTCSKCDQIRKFRKNYPDILVLDDAAGIYACNKNWAATLFDDNDLKIYRPTYSLHKKIYSAALAKKINDYHQSDILVIKPLNAAKGHGIIMIKKEDLEKTLNIILTGTIIPDESPDASAYNYWINDKNDHFIVESYVPSKPVIVDGRSYDATMRMVFVLHHDKGRMHVTFLDGYWKLPRIALEEEGTLTEKAKSSIREDRKSSEKINPEDMQKAQNLMKDMLPQLYLKMLEEKRKELINS